ncbi:MAG: homogentisate 1,2-dioxygenase [Bdellovibrionales bacterium]|nr:homogentisate 1,2-dioxygenase [Bdellovibrionales bacterium]
MKPEAICKDPKSLKYVRGWSYHDQLNGLISEAPHILPKRESWPAGVEDIREQEITRAGFQPTAAHSACYLYRSHPGPGWRRDGARPISKEEVAPGWVTGMVQRTEVPESQLPRKYKSQAASPKGHCLQNLVTLFYNADVSAGVTQGSEPMPFFFRNADGDDLYFVHHGEGVIETELGLIGYEPGHMIWIPKGLAYRIVPMSEKHELFHFENYGENFQKPDTSFTGDAAVYYHRNIEVPVSCYVPKTGDHEVVVKANGVFTAYTHPHHPMDVVGWDGTWFPFRLHVRDIQPITSYKSHVPPSAYCMFCGTGFEYCAFVPRPVETGERSLPVPFDHINCDRDEVIFYSRGVFFSKDTSDEGTVTFHPRGVSHGPHPASLQRSLDRREKEGAFMFDGYFILLETNRPLFPTKYAAEYEESSYINSWQ